MQINWIETRTSTSASSAILNAIEYDIHHTPIYNTHTHTRIYTHFLDTCDGNIPDIQHSKESN